MWLCTYGCVVHDGVFLQYLQSFLLVITDSYVVVWQVILQCSSQDSDTV